MYIKRVLCSTGIRVAKSYIRDPVSDLAEHVPPEVYDRWSTTDKFGHVNIQSLLHKSTTIIEFRMLTSLLRPRCSDTSQKITVTS